MTATYVEQALDQGAVQCGLPRAFTADSSTEFIWMTLDECVRRRDTKLNYTRSGRPSDRGHIESFNSRLRVSVSPRPS